MIVYRAMREDKKNKGKPEVGNSANSLGVRTCGPHKDISIIKGVVHPNTGGMSVTPNDPSKLPPHRLPSKLLPRSKKKRGSKSNSVFSFQVDKLNPPLALCGCRSDHALVGPLDCCVFSEFEQALYDTQNLWTKMSIRRLKKLMP